MLEEYFMMEISEDGRLLTLPLLLPGYTPNFNRLPSFLMRLGPGVSSSLLALLFSCIHRNA
jgi:DNA mismatch repair protein MLH1